MRLASTLLCRSQGERDMPLWGASQADGSTAAQMPDDDRRDDADNHTYRNDEAWLYGDGDGRSDEGAG